MIIYAAADIHGAQYRINDMVEVISSYKPDIVTVCGDITQFGPGDVATNFLDQLPVTTLAIPGNIDTNDVVDGIKQSHAEYMHLHRFDRKGVSFIGMNGVSEKETMAFFRDSSNGKLLKDIDVIMTHVPPFGFQDTVFLGRHAGSKILLEIMKELKPRLFLCGHIHENPGFTDTGDTIVVNCSMGKKGRGAIIDLGKSIDIEMIS